MKKKYSLLVVVVLLIAACSKKSGPNPTVATGIPTSTATVVTFAGSGNQGSVNEFGNTASNIIA